MGRLPLRATTWLVLAAAVGAGQGCSALFSFEPAPGPSKDAGSGVPDAAMDASGDGAVGIDAGVDAATDAAAGLDAATDAAVDDAAIDSGPPCEPDEDEDGDGSLCVDDCDDHDPLRRPAAWPTIDWEEIGDSSSHFAFGIRATGELEVVHQEGTGLYLATRVENGWLSEGIADFVSSTPQQIAMAQGEAATYACFWVQDNDIGTLGVWSSATWLSVELASDLGGPGPWCAIAIDDVGTPHIAYFDPSTGYMSHTQLTGDEWSAPDAVGLAWDVLDPDVYASRMGLAILDGAPLAAYRDEATNGIVFSTLQDGGGWAAGLAAIPLSRNPVVVADAGAVSTCFRDTSEDAIRYMEWATDHWTGSRFVGVPAADDSDNWCSLAQTNVGPVVVWTHEPAGSDAQEPYIARRTGAGWIDGAPLNPAVAEWERPRVAVDPEGHVHVVLQDDDVQRLWHGVLVDDCSI